MTALAIRPAAISDAAEIHELLLGMAAALPLTVATLGQEEALYTELRKTLGWGESWVAVDGDHIVGCMLVDNVQTGRHWGENAALDLRHAAGDGLDELLAKVLERTAPVTAAVKDANRTGLAERLRRAGFRRTGARVGEQHFRRDPGGHT